MSDPRLAQAHHLLNLGRHSEAEKVLGAHLAGQPEDVLALCWMALAIAAQNRVDDALQHATRAVQIEPAYAYGWFVLAGIQFDGGRAVEAEEAIAEAIRLDPEHAESFALLASMRARRKQWQEALDAADAGLRVDPENDDCTNVRAFALRGLGRADEAARALEGQLHRTPEDSRTHANRGWTLLQQRDYDGALDHFREALRLDPTAEWARQGVVETLKARHWFYRPALRYFLWMSRLSGRVQLLILLGGYGLYRLALALAKQDLPIQPVLWGIVAVYVAFVATSWFASPIANALLWFHPLGRLALTRRESAEAWAICGLLATSAVLVLVGWFGDGIWVVAGLALAILCLPLKLTFDLERPRARTWMWAYTGLMVVFGGWWVIATMDVQSTVSELVPVVARAEQLGAERQQIEDQLAEVEGDTTELRRQLDDVGVREAELEAEFPRPELERRIEAVRSARRTASNLGLWYALLGFWISQFVASKLAAREERR